MFKKAWAIIFLLILILIAASCSADDADTSPNRTENNSDGQTEEDADGISGYVSPVPDDVDFDGRVIRVYHYDAGSSFDMEEETGDTVDDAVYRRNQIVEGKLNIQFNHIIGSNNAGITNSVKAGMDEYDFVTATQWQAVQLLPDGIYREITQFPHLDITQPWWATDYINEFKITGDKIFFVTGDWNHNFLGSQSAIFVNKQLYQDQGFADDLYQVVWDGKWTFDKYTEMVRGMYKDLDGDGQATDADQYGTALIVPTFANHLTFAAGIKIFDRDENGLPVLNVINERNTKWAEMMLELYSSPGTRWFHPNPTQAQLDSTNVMFAEDRLLFLTARFWNAGSAELRAMNTDFMVIPYPKYDELEPIYRSLVHDSCYLLGVPTTANIDDEILGAIFAELAYQGFDLTTPAFYEVALKNKYVRDYADIPMQILDMIREGATTEFGYIYNYALGEVGNVFAATLDSRSADLVSTYERMERRVEDRLERMINTYLE